jgi:hypothetical protein
MVSVRVYPATGGTTDSNRGTTVKSCQDNHQRCKVILGLDNVDLNWVSIG